MSLANVQTLTAAASAAFASGDFATARSKAGAALALLGGIPTTQHGERRIEVEDMRKANVELIRLCDRGLAGGAGIQTTKIVKRGPTS